MAKKRSAPKVGAWCPKCLANPGEPCRGKDGKSCKTHVERLRLGDRAHASTANPRRKAGSNGTRLARTRVVTPEIRAKMAKARRPSKVTISYVCPICGGPHSRADHK